MPQRNGRRTRIAGNEAVEYSHLEVVMAEIEEEQPVRGIAAFIGAYIPNIP